MSCFWTDLVAATQFCEVPAGPSGGFGLYTDSYFDSGESVFRPVITSATGTPVSLADAFAVALTAPLAELGTGGVESSLFFLKPSAGWLVSNTAAVAGISTYSSAPTFVDTTTGLNLSEVFDDALGEYVAEAEDSVLSGSFTVTEAFLCFLQENGGGSVHGIAAAPLDTSRFTVGLPSMGVLRVDYAGGAAPSIGDYTLYGSADALDPINDTGRIMTVVRAVGTVVTGASGSVPVDCYITGYRNGEV